MIHPHEIAFDIDGVFADTMGLFIDIIRDEYGIDHVRYDQITEYYLESCLDVDPEIITAAIRRILDGNHDHALEPLAGSRRVLTAVGQEAPLLFVTARPTPSIRDWVLRMLPDVPYPIEVIATGAYEAKAGVLNEHGKRYFIEDSLDACRLLHQHRITPLLFIQPWNRTTHSFHEVRNWHDIADLIDLTEL